MRINLPNNPMKKEEIIQKNKAMFKEDLDKGGSLAKVLVFTKIYEPVNSQDLKNYMVGYYHLDIDLNLIKRALKKLGELGILHSITSGDIVIMANNERLEIHKKIYDKFFNFLEHIPKQFRRQYNQVNYYWVSNGEGEAYLEWCCKILGFDFEK
jgi:hypothetical protein